MDEFSIGDNNIFVDDLSDDDVAASKNDGFRQRGFEKSKLMLWFVIVFLYFLWC